MTVAEGNVHAPHHLIDGVDGFGDHTLDVPNKEARVVGSDQLTPKSQILIEAFAQRATEPQGFIIFGRTVRFDRGSLAATCNPCNRDAVSAIAHQTATVRRCSSSRAQAPTPGADLRPGLAAYPPGSTPGFGG